MKRLASTSSKVSAAKMLGLDRHYLADAGGEPDIVRTVVGLTGPYDFYRFDAQRATDAMGNAPDPLSTQPITLRDKMHRRSCS